MGTDQGVQPDRVRQAFGRHTHRAGTDAGACGFPRRPDRRCRSGPGGPEADAGPARVRRMGVDRVVQQGGGPERRQSTAAAGEGSARPGPRAAGARTMSPGFLAELRRRNVYRAAALYTASAWLLVQVATS